MKQQTTSPLVRIPAPAAALRSACSVPASRCWRATPARAEEDDKVLTEAQVLRDPDIPVIGNPPATSPSSNGSTTNCPYCRKLAPELRAGGAGRRQGPPDAEGLADPRAGVQGRRADGAGGKIPGTSSKPPMRR